ncbi:MAG: hypothetical protein CMM32_07145 [Rhodospirillaceae bacterium]|nr:hypothetical protein [Rhodospirillaceae bacterium]
MTSKHGIIAVAYALAAIPVIMAIGGALDFGRAYLLQSRLAEALDKAALAVGAETTTNTAILNQTLNNYFNANFNADGVGRTLNIASDITDSRITLRATGSVDTAFLKIINKNEIVVTVTTEVVRETTGLEVVLVLDNTGSMAANNRIGNLKVAARELVDILFQNEDRPENVRIALVPFVTTVNIGQENVGFIRTPIPENDYAPPRDPRWKGCVEARPFPHDTSDVFDINSDVAGLWDPYYWESEPVLDGFGGFFNVCENMWWLPNLRRGLSRPIATGRSGANFGTYPDRSTPPRFFNVDTIPPSTHGPNKACPDPITPLNNDRGRLRAAINQMQPWSGNGTMAHLGAVWAWRVLSPGPPFQEGRGRGAQGIKRAVIILTDGVNLVSSGRSNCSRFVDARYNSQYTGYGYLSENRLGTQSFTGATAVLNDRLSDVCTNLKRDDITVYTITFELNDATTQEVFRRCASEPKLYFPSPDSSTLQESFRAIGASLNALRIAR